MENENGLVHANDRNFFHFVIGKNEIEYAEALNAFFRNRNELSACYPLKDNVFFAAQLAQGNFHLH